MVYIFPADPAAAREAPFRLNLVYDERQERTIEAKKVRAAIDSKGRSYDALVRQHARRRSTYGSTGNWRKSGEGRRTSSA